MNTQGSLGAAEKKRRKCKAAGCPGYVTYEPEIVFSLVSDSFSSYKPHEVTLECDGPDHHFLMYEVPNDFEGHNP